jgi:radical SAM superfamily enzyme YgiQ (UPF0313 family)
MEDCFLLLRNFDILLYGESELALIPLLEAVDKQENFFSVPNALFEYDGKVIRTKEKRLKEFSCDDVMAVYDDNIYLAMAGNSKMKLICVEDSRGCNCRCNFCMHPIKSGQTIRLKSIRQFMTELIYLNKTYGFCNYFCSGSNTPYTHFVNIIKEIKKEKLDVCLSFFQSCRDFEVDSIDVLSNSNLLFLWIGAETGSQILLDKAINKRSNIDNVKGICRLLRHVGVNYVISCIYPLPGENCVTTKEHLDFITNCNPDCIILSPPLVQPRTNWFISNEYIEVINRDDFVINSMFGLEEVENKILPPMVSNQLLSSSIRINGKTYRDIYFDYYRFSNLFNESSNFVESFNGSITRTEQLVRLTNETNKKIKFALLDGSFINAKEALVRYNELVTSGSISNCITAIQH